MARPTIAIITIIARTNTKRICPPDRRRRARIAVIGVPLSLDLGAAGRAERDRTKGGEHRQDRLEARPDGDPDPVPGLAVRGAGDARARDVDAVVGGHDEPRYQRALGGDR